MASWSIYLIRDDSNSLYTGISIDVGRRFQEHCSGSARGAKYTRSRKSLALVYSCELGSRSLACRAEYRLKRLSKKEKERIVAGAPDAAALCTTLGISAT